MNAADDYRNYPSLTDREADVLRLVHKGTTDRGEMSKVLGISKQRVANLLFIACHKMKYPNNEEAAAQVAYNIAAI